MEPQDTIVSEDAEIIEIDASQLEEFLAANNGTAEFVDQHGNTIRLTAQELLNAGFAAESLEESSLAGITDVSTYADGSDGGFYVIETGDHEPPRLELVDESSALSENVAKDTDSVDESQSDKPPVLSASVPLRSGERCVPSDAQDVQQLRELYEEYCKELRDKEKKLAAQFSQLKIVEERTLILANALVKNVQWEEAEVYVDAQDVPDSVTATVCVKRPKPNEAPPEDAIVVQLDSGESCFVIAQDLSGQTLRSHGGSTDNEKRNAMLRCDRCPRRFALESELTYHQKNEHPPRFPFYCRYCDKELLFITERDFQAHGRMFHRKQITGEIDTMSIDAVKSEEEEPQWELLEMEKWNEPSNETDRVQGGEHKCTVCFRNFPTAFSASRHVREEHMITDEQRLLTMVVPSRNMDLSISTCEICKRTFSKREFLERHKIAHTDDVPYACKLCPRKFKWQYNLQKHMTTHGSRGNFKCTECNQVFHSQARVDVHYKARHPGRPKDQICPLCEVAFSEKESLAKHMRSHGGSLFPCSECDKKFVDKNFLLRHMFVHTGVKKYVCEVCGKVFSVVEQLAAHKHVHKERKFACDKCEWRFASTADLKRHRKWHDPRYKEVCLKCGSRFRTKEELKAHTEKWHQPRKKRFQCGICTKQFAKIENLTVHVDKHRQICAFPCTKCDRAFSKQDALSRHMRLHAGAKGHRCLVCNESFDTKEQIMSHMFSHMKRRMHYIVVAMKHGATEATIVPKPKEPKLEIGHEKAQTIVVGAELQSEALEEKRSDLSFAGLNNPQNVNEDSRGIANDSAPVQLLNEGMPLLPEQLINQDISK